MANLLFYVQEQGWDREEGLEKILNSKSSGARGCWHVIRKSTLVFHLWKLVWLFYNRALYVLRMKHWKWASFDCRKVFANERIEAHPLQSTSTSWSQYVPREMVRWRKQCFDGVCSTQQWYKTLFSMPVNVTLLPRSLQSCACLSGCIPCMVMTGKE